MAQGTPSKKILFCGMLGVLKELLYVSAGFMLIFSVLVIEKSAMLSCDDSGKRVKNTREAMPPNCGYS